MNRSREARDPFEQLERSHRRLEERLEDLVAMARDARERQDAAPDLDGIRDVARFFGRGVRRHEEDEESSLFPRLRQTRQIIELAPLLDRLAAEHQEHAALHARLDALLLVLDRTPGDAAGIVELGQVAEALTNAYRTHLAEEERTLFPAARAAFDADTLQAISDEMQARRGDGGRRTP